MDLDKLHLHSHERDGDYDDEYDYEPPPYGSRVTPGKVAGVSRLSLARIMREALSGSSLAPDAADMVDRASADPGTSLPQTLLEPLEKQLGTELSGVRVHTSASSQHAAQALQANAYTVGQDIHFASGKYAPDTSSGQRLIAHEVAHTVQQQDASAGPQTELEVSQPGDAHEVEADSFADAFMGDKASSELTPVSTGSVSREAIQRDATPDSGGTTVSKKKEVEIDFGGGKKIKITENSVQGSVKFDDIKYPEEAFEESYRFEPLQFCPLVYGYIGVDCSAGVSDSMMVTVAGTKTGEGDDAQWSLAVTGENVVKGEAKASMSLGLAVGCPGIANMSAEAAAIPTAALEFRTGVTGALTWSKDAGVSGYLEFPMKAKGVLEVELALRLMYEVFWEDHPVEFAKYTVGKWEIATAVMEGIPRYTIGEGWSANVIEPVIKWGGAPDPAHIGGRAAADQKSLYERRQESYDQATDGASGAPAWHPDDDADSGEVLIDDGQGVNQMSSADGGMCMPDDDFSTSSEPNQSIDPSLGGMSRDGSDEATS